jgi:histidinol-phosphate aminotransferase
VNRWVTDTIEQLRPYAAGKPIEELERELGISGACKLASNENPLGPSPRATAAAQAALTGLHRYPDAGAYELRQALAQRLGVSPAEIVFGNGSNELLDLLVRTFCTAEHHVVFGEPAFVVYRMAAMASSVSFTAVPLVEQVHDLPAMADAVQANTRLIFVANPNNPTGTHVSHSALTHFLKRLPESVIPVMDEAYFEYATADDYPDSLKLRELHPNLIVLRTFSKAYGLAALRLGYAVCPLQLADYLNRVRAPFNANSVAQVAAMAALGDEDHLKKVVTLNAQERARVTAELSALGLRVWPSQANFVLVGFGRSGAELYDALLRLGVITRPVPPLPETLRITIGTPEENTRLIAAVKAVLG